MDQRGDDPGRSERFGVTALPTGWSKGSVPSGTRIASSIRSHRPRLSTTVEILGLVIVSWVMWRVPMAGRV